MFYKMKEHLSNWIIEGLSFMPQEFIVFFVSMMPILELRGGVPIGLMFDFPLWKTFMLTLIGNIIPVFFILLFFERVSGFLLNFNLYKKIYKRLKLKVEKKGRFVEKIGYLALIVFVAIPVPTSGAYTACLLAIFFSMNKKWAFIMISIGIFIANCIVSFLLYAII